VCAQWHYVTDPTWSALERLRLHGEPLTNWPDAMYQEHARTLRPLTARDVRSNSRSAHVLMRQCSRPVFDPPFEQTVAEDVKQKNLKLEGLGEPTICT
jgi:hypothetical protein